MAVIKPGVALLTVHLFVSDKILRDELSPLLLQLIENGITVKQYDPDASLVEMQPKHPRVYISLGPEWQEFSSLVALPSHEKKLWLHFNSPEEIKPNYLFYCFLKTSDPMREKRVVPPVQFSSDTPLVSVFTASYRSKEKIQRPYQSLLNQTNPNSCKKSISLLFSKNTSETPRT